ncbi:MAG: hypothetical protein F4X64_14330 [Chloroflexi bacterium]|nr:hypothetical protein [Chloroflexota bacterium]
MTFHDEVSTLFPSPRNKKNMAIQRAGTYRQNTQATGYMLAAVAGYSVVPLIVALSNGAESPFLFNTGLTFGVGVGQAIFLGIVFRNVLFHPSVLRLVRRNIFRYSMLLTVIHRFDYGLFALATRFIDVSVASVIFETWPIVSLFVTAYLFRHEGRYQKITLGMVLLLALAFIGFFFVASSETGVLLNFIGVGSLETGVGVILVILAVVIASFVAFTFRWGEDFNNVLCQEAKEVIDKENSSVVLISCVILASCIGALISSVFNLVIGVGIGESISTNSVVAAVIGGALAYGTANITYRVAIAFTSNLGISAMLYATPLVALFWLFIFSQVNVARLDYLIIGATAIIVINLLINFEAEIRFGFKALVLALWAFGTFVYLRDDLLNLLPFETWLWPGDTYPEALGLSATIFILLLSFRVARMSERTQDEDNRILELFQSLDLLVRRNVIDRAVRDHLIKLDDARTPADLQRAYNKAKLCFAEAVAVGPDARNLARLGAAETQLNIIVHSRQQGIELGELFALIIFGGSTILIGILSRPPLTGWIGFLVEILAALFSAVIVFLIINVWDLHRERADLILKKREESNDYGLIFSNPRSRRFERSMSVIIGLAIIFAYAALLWQKWLP